MCLWHRRADLAERLTRRAEFKAEYSSESRSAAHETASLFVDDALMFYAHINDGGQFGRSRF